VKQINQTTSEDGNANNLQHQTDKKPPLPTLYQPRLWPAIITTAALVFVGGGGVGVLMWASAVFTDTAAAVSFVAQNVLSLFVLLAVVVQGCIYWSQRGLMKRQWEAMDDSLEETRNIVRQNERTVTAVETQAERMGSQVSIMQGQLNAMQETLGEMRISRELENRAWIGVSELEIMDAKNDKKAVDIIATFVNSGNSPAVVTIDYFLQTREESPPDDIDVEPLKEKDKGSRIAFFPHTERKVELHRFNGGLPLSPNPKNSAHTLYIWGILTYEDIFGHKHTTRFCYYTHIIEVGNRKAVVPSVAPTHNSFD
jgi:hypothetical protein